jgi:predicted Zn-dependent protease
MNIDMGQYGKLAKKSKVSEYDIYSFKATLNEIQLRGIDVEAVREPVNAVGYNVRVLTREGDLVGIGSASTSQESKLDECIHNAKFLSTLNKRKIKYEFPQQKPDPRVSVVDDKIRNSPVEAINEFANSVLSRLKEEGQSSKPVKPTFGKIRTYLLETEIENSTGLTKRKVETYFYLELALKVTEGTKFAEFWPRKYRRRISDVEVDELLPEWLKMARDSLEAKVAPTGKMPVIMNPESLCDLIVIPIGAHSAGDQKFRNQSVFNKGDVVASETLSIADDGLFDYGLISAPFDDEGTPQQVTPIIDKGVFKNFICDQKYALMLGEKPTGNGIKQMGILVNPMSKHLAPIATSPTNMRISPGTTSFDDLVGDVKDGILVEQFSWLNPDFLSSSFSSEIRNGYLIRNGEVEQPLKGGLVSGKVFDLMKNISCVSNSARIESGASAFSIVAPYIRFENVQVAGT